MSTLMQILNLYATKDSQTKFEGNRMKNGKVTVLKLVEEEEEDGVRAVCMSWRCLEGDDSRSHCLRNYQQGTQFLPS